MKSLSCLVQIIVILFIGSEAIAQQGPSTDPLQNVDVGSKKYYEVKLQNDITYHVRIISADALQVMVMEPDGRTFTIQRSLILSITQKPYQNNGSIGFGLGIPYGVLGVNADGKIYQRLYLSGGIGTGIFITPMYAAGMKYNLRSGEFNFIPRASAMYGSTGMLVYSDLMNDIRAERFHGGAVGLGFLWSLGITKSWGFDFDLIYILNDKKLEDRMAELQSSGVDFDTQAVGNLKASLGIRISF